MRLLVAATISYNVVEAVVAVAAGTVAGSTALIGFGLDSVIEASSAAVLLVMPIASYAQRRADGNSALWLRSLIRNRLLLRTYLSAVLLGGLVLNSLFGWAWADPLAGLVIAAVAAKEGRDAWRGDACCTLGAESRAAIGMPD